MQSGKILGDINKNMLLGRSRDSIFNPQKTPELPLSSKLFRI